MTTPKRISNPYLIQILKRMCSIVGANYDEIDFSIPGWYTKYEWTKEQEQDFIDWLTEYLYSNTKARRSLMTISRKNKKLARQAAEQFVFMFGWKTKQGEEQ